MWDTSQKESNQLRKIQMEIKRKKMNCKDKYNNKIKGIIKSTSKSK